MRSGFQDREMSEHALPPLILLHENVRGSFVGRELFLQIFGLSMGHCGDSGGVRVCAYSNVLGVHGFMLQRARLITAMKRDLSITPPSGSIIIQSSERSRPIASASFRIIASPNLLSSS